MDLKTWVGIKSPEFARIMLAALAVECPSGSNQEGCPLFRIRSLPHQKRDEWVQSLSEAEISALYAVHFKCLKDSE